jgi:hypothetical protein
MTMTQKNTREEEAEATRSRTQSVVMMIDSQHSHSSSVNSVLNVEEYSRFVVERERELERVDRMMMDDDG